jgi:hypothetical protein
MIDSGENSSLSWLTLERLAAGELSASERESLERALAADPESARIVERIRADERPLPSLPTRAPGQPAGRRASRASWRERWAGILHSWRLPAMAGALLAAAVLLVWLARPDATHSIIADMPGPRLHIGDGTTKGGDVAISLVRERAGAITHEPDSYQDGDRFKVLLTCPLGIPLFGDIVVYQEDGQLAGQETGQAGQAGQEASFPFARRGEPLACGNRVALPGAFALSAGDAQADAYICLVFDSKAAPDRSALEHPQTMLSAGDRAVCATLVHQ